MIFFKNAANCKFNLGLLIVYISAYPLLPHISAHVVFIRSYVNTTPSWKREEEEKILHKSKWQENYSRRFIIMPANTNELVRRVTKIAILRKWKPFLNTELTICH